jgi:hypothetical protein
VQGPLESRSWAGKINLSYRGRERIQKWRSWCWWRSSWWYFNICLGFGMSVVLKMLRIVVVWVMTSCTLVGGYQRFGSNIFPPFSEVHSWPNGGGNMFLWHDCPTRYISPILRADAGSLFLINDGTHLPDDTMSLIQKITISILMFALESSYNIKTVSYFA